MIFSVGSNNLDYRIIIAVLVMLLLTGCSEDKGVKVLDDYLDRISNVVQLERTADENFQLKYRVFSQTTRFPDLDGKIYEPQSDQTIGLIDFLSLHGCELQVLVAQRNSTLGKLAKPSQQLLYEVNFLKHSSECIQHIKDKERYDLADQLSSVATMKKEQLPHYIWRAILGGNESTVFWKQAKYIGDYPDADTIQLENSLGMLKTYAQDWLKGDFSRNIEMFEQSLSLLNLSEGGALLKSLLLYKLALEEANQLLDRATLCRNHRPQFNTVAAQNVVTKFFVGRVQVWASQLSQRYYAIMPAYKSIEILFEAFETSEYHSWRLRRDFEFEQAINLSHGHVKRLQTLFQGCANKSMATELRGSKIKLPIFSSGTDSSRP